MPTVVALRPGGWSATTDDNTPSNVTRLHPIHPLTRSAPYSLDPVGALLPKFAKHHKLQKSSLSILSNPSEPLPLSPNHDYVFNNYDSYKRVCEWFDCWRDWQKRILLCGITNR